MSQSAHVPVCWRTNSLWLCDAIWVNTEPLLELMQVDLSSVGFCGLWPSSVKGRTPGEIFNCIFLNQDIWISIKNSLKFVPKRPVNNIPAFSRLRVNTSWRRHHWFREWFADFLVSNHYLNRFWLLLLVTPLRTNFSENFIQNTKPFMQENHFGNVVCISRPFCLGLNVFRTGHPHWLHTQSSARVLWCQLWTRTHNGLPYGGSSWIPVRQRNWSARVRRATDHRPDSCWVGCPPTCHRHGRSGSLGPSYLK